MMKRRAIITLLTDFGVSDEYVGVMKGVMASISPEAQVIDISHGVPPQDIETASQMITAAYRYFPINTIHVIVVDPGVGSDRAIIAVSAAGQFFLAPNNGLLTGIIGNEKDIEIRKIERTDLFLSPISHTFHGRDILSPVAAHLASGLPFESLGPVLKKEKWVIFPAGKQIKIHPGEIEGAIVRIDHFGNLISNIDADLIDRHFPGHRRRSVVIDCKGSRIQGISDRYADAAKGKTVAVIGSRNHLEIAVYHGSAKVVLKAEPLDPIRVYVFPGN